MDKREYLRTEIEHRGIYRCEPGTYIPSKAMAKFYTWQFYLRRCLYDSKFTDSAADMLVELLSNRDVQVGACEDAGVVLGMAIAARLGTPMFSIKKTPKAYGLQNKLEGRLTGQPVLLVDDLAGSQATLRSSRQMLTMMNITVANEYVTLINKTTGTHADAYPDGMRLVSLFTCDDFKLTWADYVTEYNKKPEFGVCY
jgi:orotate phosphoribosyltransferase